MRGSSVVLPRIPRDRLQLQRCLKSQVNNIIAYGSLFDETTQLFFSSQRCDLLLNSCLLLRNTSETSACSEQESNLWRSEFVGCSFIEVVKTPKGRKLSPNLFCLGIWFIKLHSSDTCPILLLGFQSSFFLLYEVLLCSLKLIFFFHYFCKRFPYIRQSWPSSIEWEMIFFNSILLRNFFRFWRVPSAQWRLWADLCQHAWQLQVWMSHRVYTGERQEVMSR